MAVEVQLTIGVLNGVVFGLIIALIAIGLSLIFGLIGVVNIAHGELYMLGAVVGWFTVNFFGGYLVALALAPLVVGVIGFGIERGILRPMRYDPHRTIIATIGLLFIIQHGVLAFFGPTPRSIDPPLDFLVQMPGFGYSGYRMLTAGAAAALLVVVWALIYRTNFGLFIRASQQNREMATALGIPVGRVYMLAFGLSSALAALGAVLSAPLLSVHYLIGLDVLVLSFIVVIIGGMGSLKGTFVAAMLVATFEGVMSTFFTPTDARMFSLLFLAGVLLVRPAGLFGKPVV